MKYTKFHSIEDYDISIQDIQIVAKTNTSDKKINLAIVYCAWSHPQYVKFLYLSLISQYRFTDALNCDIFCFCDDVTLPEAYKRLEGFPIVIVHIESPFNKYTVLQRKELQKYDKIVIIDCDTFMFGRKTSVYETIHNTLEKSDSVYMMRDRANTEWTFFVRMRDLTRPKINRAQYLDFFSKSLFMDKKDLQAAFKKKRWYLSCFMIFNAKLYRSNKWKKFAVQCNNLRTMCDETVFLVFGWSKGYNFKDFNSIDELIRVIPSYDLRGFLMSKAYNNVLGIVHPLHGTYAWRDTKLLKFFYDFVSRKPLRLSEGMN